MSPPLSHHPGSIWPWPFAMSSTLLTVKIWMWPLVCFGPWLPTMGISVCLFLYTGQYVLGEHDGRAQPRRPLSCTRATMAACRDETGGEVVVLLLLAAVTAEAVVGNMGQHLPPGPECTWWKQRLPIINQVIKSCTACKIVNFSLIQAEHLGLLLLQQGVLFLTNDGYEQIVKVWWDLNLSRLMDDNLQHKRNLSPSHHFRLHLQASIQLRLQIKDAPPQDFTPTSRQYSTKKRLVYTEPATADNQESDDQFKKSRTDKANESTDFENEADVPGTATC